MTTTPGTWRLDPATPRVAYRVREVCTMTGLGRTLVLAEIRAGRLEVVRVGARCTLILPDAIQAWLRGGSAPSIEGPPEPAPRRRRGR